MPLAVGDHLGPYEILAPIGKGGMGEVYRALDTRLGREVAIKVAQERFSDRFEREARVIATLNHPNICTLYDVGPNYLVMEYIEGEPLKGPLAAEQAVANALQILDALEAAHTKEIVHRDLKPDNILVSKSGVKLLDFGLAKQTREAPRANEETQTLSLTHAGAVVGTPAYMAPEQWEGGTADARSDIYAFGCVLYEMLTGERARAERAQVKPAALEAVLSKCLARNPADRYQSVAEIRERLQAKTAMVSRTFVIAAASVAALGLAAGFWVYRARPVHALNDTDTVVLADFTNTTGDKDFDETLQNVLQTDLQESPFLSILSDQTVNATLKLMGQKPGTRLTADVAREVCQRAAGKAYFGGSIARLGSRYVIGLKAVNCQTGASIAQATEPAKSKDDVMVALDKATESLRKKVGEPLASIEKLDLPVTLQQTTTASLEAWQSATLGRKEVRDGVNRGAEGVPLFQRAIQLDPNFAMAHLWLGMTYMNLGENTLAGESISKAFAMRDRVSKWEQFAIESRYYTSVVGDLEKGRSVYEEWARIYPRNGTPLAMAALIEANLGDFQAAVEEGRKAAQLDPGAAPMECNLLSFYMGANLLRDAKAAAVEHLRQRPNSQCDHEGLFNVAFLVDDTAGMSNQLAWAKQQGSDELARYEGVIANYHGHLEKAREIYRHQVAGAQRKNQEEAAASIEATAALLEALFGYRSEAQKRAHDALKLSHGKETRYFAALAYGLDGDAARALGLADDLERSFPEDTIVRFNFVPTLHALIELDRGNPTDALQRLQAAALYELGDVTAALWPVYVRGQAYIAARQGVEAAVEFQKILAHRGVIYNLDVEAPSAPIDALAHVGLARAFALAGDSAKARAAYQDFFTIWKDADAGIPVLKEAHAEFNKLN
jgi:tetratricopeptide (TPR) repeat protein/predicted Ser/Thr protein kinase